MASNDVPKELSWFQAVGSKSGSSRDTDFGKMKCSTLIVDSYSPGTFGVLHFTATSKVKLSP